MKKLLFFVCIFYSQLHSTPTAHTITRSHKTQCHYYLQREHLNNKEQFSIVLMLHGSEADSVTHFMPLIDTSWCIHNKCALLGIEKPGVTKDTCDKKEYFKYNTLTQRASDCVMVIEHLRLTEPLWNGKLIILGGSEGGTLAAYVTPLLKQTVATIIIAGGCGMTLRQEILKLAQKENSNDVRGNVNYILSNLSINFWLTLCYLFPTDKIRAVGNTNTLRWWRSIADYNPLTSLKNVTTPLYCIHGTADTNCPIESAYALVDAFKKWEKTNLVFKEYQGFDHCFNDAQENNHYEVVTHEALAWVEQFLG